MRYLRPLCLTLAARLILAGCFSSAEEQVYAVFKCGKVATPLGREADAQAALRNGRVLLEHFQTPGGSQARYAMLLGERF